MFLLTSFHVFLPVPCRLRGVTGFSGIRQLLLPSRQKPAGVCGSSRMGQRDAPFVSYGMYFA